LIHRRQALLSDQHPSKRPQQKSPFDSGPGGSDNARAYDYGSEGCVFESRRVRGWIPTTYKLIAIRLGDRLGHFLATLSSGRGFDFRLSLSDGTNRIFGRLSGGFAPGFVSLTCTR
jgi:hypothetical protein